MNESDEKRLERRQRRFIMGVALLVLLCIVVSVAEFHTAPKQSRPKIGMIMRGAREDEGWNKVQYEGLNAAAKELGMDVIVKENALRSIGEYRKILNSSGNTRTSSLFCRRRSFPRIIWCRVRRGFLRYNIWRA